MAETMRVFACPKCGLIIEQGASPCPYCRTPIAWDGVEDTDQIDEQAFVSDQTDMQHFIVEQTDTQDTLTIISEPARSMSTDSTKASDVVSISIQDDLGYNSIDFEESVDEQITFFDIKPSDDNFATLPEIELPKESPSAQSQNGFGAFSLMIDTAGDKPNDDSRDSVQAESQSVFQSESYNQVQYNPMGTQSSEGVAQAAQASTAAPNGIKTQDADINEAQAKDIEPKETEPKGVAIKTPNYFASALEAEVAEQAASKKLLINERQQAAAAAAAQARELEERNSILESSGSLMVGAALDAAAKNGNYSKNKAIGSASSETMSVYPSAATGTGASSSASSTPSTPSEPRTSNSMDDASSDTTAFGTTDAKTRAEWSIKDILKKPVFSLGASDAKADESDPSITSKEEQSSQAASFLSVVPPVKQTGEDKAEKMVPQKRKKQSKSFRAVSVAMKLVAVIVWAIAIVVLMASGSVLAAAFNTFSIGAIVDTFTSNTQVSSAVSFIIFGFIFFGMAEIIGLLGDIRKKTR